MGANLPSSAGPPDATLAEAARRLSSLGRVTALSSIYSTAPVGFADQPRFLNAVAALQTDLTPFELLGALLLIEKDFGRDRARYRQNGPRTLDLDILLFGDFVIGGATLDVPHPRLAERAFVLVPMNEIAPHAIEPRTARSMSKLMESLFPSGSHDIETVVQFKSDYWRARTGANHSAIEP